MNPITIGKTNTLFTVNLGREKFYLIRYQLANDRLNAADRRICDQDIIPVVNSRSSAGAARDQESFSEDVVSRIPIFQLTSVRHCQTTLIV